MGCSKWMANRISSPWVQGLRGWGYNVSMLCAPCGLWVGVSMYSSDSAAHWETDWSPWQPFWNDEYCVSRTIPLLAALFVHLGGSHLTFDMWVDSRGNYSQMNRKQSSIQFGLLDGLVMILPQIQWLLGVIITNRVIVVVFFLTNLNQEPKSSDYIFYEAEHK